MVLWGPGAGAFVRSIIKRIKPGVPCYRKLREGEILVDEVVALLVPAEQAPTGAEEGEICFHGGGAARKEVLSFLERRGAQLASFSEYAASFVRCDRVQQEALEALPKCTTDRACAFLLRQLGGELSRLVLKASGGGREELRRIAAELEQRSRFGTVLVEGARVVVVGPPNVGKSTLINRLAGRQRAIVTDVPGTTRDLLEAEAEIDGVPVVFIDTAGLRDDASEVELLGAQLAEQALRQADLVLCLGCEPSSLPGGVPRALRLGPKADLGGSFPPEVLPVSGLTGQGLEELKLRILRALGAGEPPGGVLGWSEERPPDPPAPFTERQVRLAACASEAARRGDLKAAGEALREFIRSE